MATTCDGALALMEKARREEDPKLVREISLHEENKGARDCARQLLGAIRLLGARRKCKRADKRFADLKSRRFREHAASRARRSVANLVSEPEDRCAWKASINPLCYRRGPLREPP